MRKEQIATRVQRPLADQIREIAAARDTSVSSTVRFLLRHAVQQYDAPLTPLNGNSLSAFITLGNAA